MRATQRDENAPVAPRTRMSTIIKTSRGKSGERSVSGCEKRGLCAATGKRRIGSDVQFQRTRGKLMRRTSPFRLRALEPTTPSSRSFAQPNDSAKLQSHAVSSYIYCVRCRFSFLSVRLAPWVVNLMPVVVLRHDSQVPLFRDIIN